MKTCNAYTFAPYARANAVANGSAASEGSEKSVKYRIFFNAIFVCAPAICMTHLSKAVWMDVMMLAVTGLTVFRDTCHLQLDERERAIETHSVDWLGGRAGVGLDRSGQQRSHVFIAQLWKVDKELTNSPKVARSK